MPNARDNLSLGKMVTILAGKLHQAGVELPFRNQVPWHLLFYTLKMEQAVPEEAEFIRELEFDWDGPFPKCEALSEYLNGFHITANVSGLNPSFDYFQVNDDDATRWSQDLEQLGENTRTFILQAVDLARIEFQH